MKYFILLERWKRETCELYVDAKNIKDAKKKALELYQDEKLENEFEDFGLNADYKNLSIHAKRSLINE